MIPDALERVRRTLAWYKANIANWADEAAILRQLPLFVHGPRLTRDGEHPATPMATCVSSTVPVTKLADHRNPKPYWEYLGEAVEPWFLPEVDLLEGPSATRPGSTVSDLLPG